MQQVFLVLVCKRDENGKEYEEHGIFSTMENATAWADKQTSPCVIAPFVLDVPEFGNVEVS